MTKAEACKEFKVSLSTLDRWISSGRVQIEKEPHGRRHRVYVVMEGGELPPVSNVPDDKAGWLADRLPDKVSLAVAQERIRGLEEMVRVLKEQVEVERVRYIDLLNQLSTGRLSKHAAGRQRPRWQFWRRC